MVYNSSIQAYVYLRQLEQVAHLLADQGISFQIVVVKAADQDKLDEMVLVVDHEDFGGFAVKIFDELWRSVSCARGWCSSAEEKLIESAEKTTSV